MRDDTQGRPWLGTVSSFGHDLALPLPEVLDSIRFVQPDGSQFALDDVWTVEEIQAFAACRERDELAALLHGRIGRLNELTGQENDPDYVALELRRGFLRATIEPEALAREVADLGIVPQVLSSGHVVRLLVDTFASFADTAVVDLESRGVTALDARDFERIGAPTLQPTRELHAAIKRTVAQVIVPPAGGARNTEVSWMQIGWLAHALMSLGPGVLHYAAAENLFGPAERLMALYYRSEEAPQRWLIRWALDGFPRLEVSHRLAAALALTDAPSDVRAPWQCFTVALPDGLFPPFSRIACGQSRSESGDHGPVNVVSLIREDGTTCGSANEGWPDEHRLGVLDNFVRSLCLALDEQPRPSGSYSGTPSVSTKKKRRGPIAGARFVVGKPVTIDLRDELKRVWEGRSRRAGASPRVQFLVRGHWRNQAHGEGRALRKRIWIEPFWKGPEEARVLLRSHGVKGGPDAAESEEA